jgi:Asp-tRNA(Asn)/Glu-tRNA(Gln) amidotransferase A subunit family amidase
MLRTNQGLPVTSTPATSHWPARCFLLACLLSAASHAQSQTADIGEASIRDLQLAMEKGELTAAVLVAESLARIAAFDDQGPALNAIIHLNPEAREQALALDEERRQTGPRGPLHGIPVILKDNYATQDMPTSGGSQTLADFIPDANATQVQRLLDAGAVILGKANLHEFAYGITTISSLGGQTRNPYDLTRIPGGSSGGSAAAVAAGFATIGMGSDTCGSIRIPAAFNNLVGLRPTKGLSSIYGVMPLSGTQDVAGPLARSITDLAVVLDIVVGYDPLDPATASMQERELPHFREQLGKASLQGVRIGRLLDYYDTAQPPVQDLLDAALRQMTEQGAVVVDIRIPGFSDLIARSGVIGQEFESDLNAWLTEFGSTDFTSLEAIVATGLHDAAVDGVLTRSAAATQDPALYRAALLARDELRTAVNAAMQAQNLELLAYPPVGALPVVIGEQQPGNNCSLSANSGLPALSLPMGFTANGLPLGIELLSAAFTDARLLALGYEFEQLTQYRRAPASTPSLLRLQR